MKLPSNIFLYHRFRFVILLSWLLLRNSDCTSLRAAISNIGEGSLLNMSFDLIGLSCYIEIKQQDGTSSDLSAVRKSQKTILPISLTFGRQGGYHTITDRLQMPTRASRQTSRSPSWPGLTRRHTEKNTRDPILVNESTNNEINGSTTQGEWSVSKLWCIENLELTTNPDQKTPNLGVSDRVRLHVVFVWADIPPRAPCWRSLVTVQAAGPNISWFDDMISHEYYQYHILLSHIKQASTHLLFYYYRS